MEKRRGKIIYILLGAIVALSACSKSADKREDGTVGPSFSSYISASVGTTGDIAGEVIAASDGVGSESADASVSEDQSAAGDESEKKTVTGIEFDDATFLFNGRAQSIFIDGELPDGVTVEYVGNGKKAAGEYEVTAKFTVTDEYEPIPDMTAIMTVVSNEKRDAIYADVHKYIDKLLAGGGSNRLWNTEGKDNWNYIDGVMMEAFVDMALATGDERYYRFVTDFIGKFVKADGSISSFSGGQLDTICLSRVLFDALEFSDDPKYAAAADYTYGKLVSMKRVNGTNNFEHKSNYPQQIWLDGMYMYGPFYARYARFRGNDDILHELYEQFANVRSILYDNETHLYHHGYEAAKAQSWADKSTGLSPVYWTRSQGWLLAAIVDVIEYFDDGDEKQFLIDMLEEALDGLQAYRDEESKCYYQVTDRPNDGRNYLETSGTALIAYAALKGGARGYLAKEYYDFGAETFEGVYEYALRDNVIIKICQSSGVLSSPNDYYSRTVVSDEAKGTAPFIMAFKYYLYGNDYNPTGKYDKVVLSFEEQGGSLVSDVVLDRGSAVGALPITEASRRVFDGWFTEAAGGERITESTVIDDDLTVYAHWIIDSGIAVNEVIDEDFDDYEANDLLAEFSGEWGEKGFYYNKSNNGRGQADSSGVYIKLGGGVADLIDTDATGNGIQLVCDLGEDVSGLITIEASVRLKSSAKGRSGWTVVQVSGTNEKKSRAEIVGIRTSGGYFAVRLNGDNDSLLSEKNVAVEDTTYAVVITIDTVYDKVSITINGERVLSDRSFSAESVCGFKIVSGDGNVNSATVDRVSVTVE